VRGTVARGWVAGPGCCLALLRLLLATGRKNASASSAFGLKMEKRTDLHFIIFQKHLFDVLFSFKVNTSVKILHQRVKIFQRVDQYSNMLLKE
jgi:hypothetical protein